MTSRIASATIAALAVAFSGAALAKLPPPSDEAKAKAAEAAAKAAHAGKVAGYELCQSMDRVAARYLAEAKKAGKDVKPVETPACVNPGPFGATAPGAPVAAAAPAPKKK